MTLAPRTWLFLSAAAGLSACASNPPMEPVTIDYRGSAPGAVVNRAAPVPTIFAGTTRPAEPVRPAPSAPVSEEPPPYQIVADLGPSLGVPAVAEARGVSPENSRRPGGGRRLPADDPSARAIEIQRNDTLYDISRRYSVNMRALIETNGLEPPYALAPGSVIHLPAPNIHVVESGETLYSVSRRYNVDTRSLGLLNGIGRPWTVYPGDELLLPPLARDQSRSQPTKPLAAATPAPQPPVLATPPAKPVPPKVAPPKSPATAPSIASVNGPISLATPTAPEIPKADPKPAPAPVAKPPVTPPAKQMQVDTGGDREFVWPISGTVLKGYGPAADGQRNDGVNISATKGTQVKAAAGGEVVYAGSELAGFGNLVLIRHPGGWVTAYAHSDSVLVREGDLVRQGQAIATVGSTGNAGSPQVHFELRKGKEPVDPSLHLPPMRG